MSINGFIFNLLPCRVPEFRITKHILNKLNIPYVIKLKYREDVINDLHNGKAQLSWGTSTQDNKKSFIFSDQSITYLVHAVDYRKGETHISNFEELKNALSKGYNIHLDGGVDWWTAIP